jgi:hypothetical protein
MRKLGLCVQATLKGGESTITGLISGVLILKQANTVVSVVVSRVHSFT